MKDDGGFWPLETSFGEAMYPPGGKLGPRLQPNLQLVLLDAGEAKIWIDGVLHTLPANSGCILFPGHEEFFLFAEATETHHTWLHLYASQYPQALMARLQRLTWSQPLSPALIQLMREALTVQAIPFSTTKELLKSLGLQMLWRYIGEGEQLAAHSAIPKSPAVDQALHYINTHLREELTLAAIAEHVAVSSPHLIRLFRTHLSTTPMHYLWQRRVALGIELLEQTGLSVGAIAEQCGFQSRYHFSRRVRQEVGYTPLEVRQRSWQRK